MGASQRRRCIACYLQPSRLRISENPTVSQRARSKPSATLCAPSNPWLHLCQRLIQVGDNIVDGLDPDRQAHKIVSDTG